LSSAIAVLEMIEAKPSFHTTEKIAGKAIGVQGRTVENRCVGPVIRSLPRLAIELTNMCSQCVKDQPFPDAVIQGDERIAKRRFADLEVAISVPKGNRLKGIIENVSENGCFVSLQDGAELAAGRLIALTLPDEKVVSGRVVWSHNRRVGICFVQPLGPDVVDDLVKRSLYARLERFQPTDASFERLDSLPKWEEQLGSMRLEEM
jgi:hypothetical protein